MNPLQQKIARDFATTRYVCYAPTGWAPFQDLTAHAYPILEDLTVLRQNWDGLITYGAEHALALIPHFAARLGFKRMIIGVYDIKSQVEIDGAIELIRRYPQMIKGLCLGNEGLSTQNYDLNELLACIAFFRDLFPDLWITTSEPIFSWGLKELVAQVDFCLPIIHPWIHEIFKDDPTMAAMWTIQAAQRLQILTNKPVLIKETGFPADGRLYPKELQVEFWKVLLRELGALTRHVFLAYFEAFDNPLKLHFSACKYWDCYWGLYNEDRSPKPVMKVIEPYLSPFSTAAFRADENEISLAAVAAQNASALQNRPSHTWTIEPSAVDRARLKSEVTVVITGKDRPDYMRHAINSVFAQIGDVRDVILVNDNSRDQAVDDLCRSYLDRAGVKYIRRTTPGSSGTARNAGLTLVETKYVCFLDDDDLFVAGKLRLQLECFRLDPDLSFVATAASVISDRGEIVGRSGSPDYFPGVPLASMLAFCRIIHSSVMMKTEVVRAVKGYLERFEGEDWELWCRFLREGHRLHYLDLPLTLYRVHESNISTRNYLRSAVQNIFGKHRDVTSKQMLVSRSYFEPSKELLMAVILLIHGQARDALELLRVIDLPIARVARFICLRELGYYPEARSELVQWTDTLDLTDELDLRLRVHERKFTSLRVPAGSTPHAMAGSMIGLATGSRQTVTSGSVASFMVGSPVVLFEQRLLAQDALIAATAGQSELDLRRYFHQSPKNISLERNEQSAEEDLFFSRVSLTSC